MTLFRNSWILIASIFIVSCGSDIEPGLVEGLPRSDSTIKNLEALHKFSLKDEDELFYRGGKFCCQKGNCIYLYNSGRKWKVPINYYDNDGNIVYTTTFFIKNSDEEIKDSDKDNKRKDEIILAQQDLIKKLTQKIRELEYHLMMNDS